MIKDSYLNSHKKKFETKLVGETLIYLRGDHFGHIKNIVAPIVNGEPDISQAQEFAERTQAIAYIYKEEQRYPERYISTHAREILAKYGHCPDCNQ